MKVEQIKNNEPRKRCQCGYRGNLDEWTRIEGDFRVTKYDPNDETYDRVGSVDLLACPACRSVIWSRTANFTGIPSNKWKTRSEL